MNNITQNQNKTFSIILLLIFITVVFGHLFFSLYHLEKAAYVDERLWTYSKQKRIEKYWNNILEHDWRNTRPSDKPGITLALISGPSLLFTTPSDFIHHSPNQNPFVQMLFIMRLPLVILGTSAIFLFFYLIKTLFNKKVAILATIFIGLSPILIGMNRIINPDALTWIFIPATLYAFLAYQKSQQKKFLYLSGILLGLGLLTKYIANLLFPFFITLIFFYPLFVKKTTSKLQQYFQKSFLNLSILTILALATFTILYPGVWVVPSRLLKGTLLSQPFEPIWKYFVTIILLIALDTLFNQAKVLTWITQRLYKLRLLLLSIIPIATLIFLISVLYYTYAPLHPIDFQNILYSPKTSLKHTGVLGLWQGLITSFYIPLFSTNPIIFLGVFNTIFIILKNLFTRRKKHLHSPVTIYLTWSLLLFILVLYSASIFNKILPVMRYQIILYPIFLTLAGFGWYYFLDQVLPKYNKLFFTQKQPIFYLFTSLTVIILLTTLFKLKPFYFSYNNFLLPQEQLVNPKDMGEGSYEAAQYLNALPNAKNLTIWSDRRGVCLFFVGNKCNRFVKKNDFLRDGPHYDYFVISKSREKKVVNTSRYYQQAGPTYPIQLDKLYFSKDKVFEINPGNRSANYIRILPENKVHVWQEK